MYHALVVDDDPVLSAIARAKLSSIGFQTHCAHDLAHARTFITQPFSLILLDIHLPDGSGLEFAREARSLPLHRNTDIVIISSDDQARNIEHAHREGKALAFLPKPINWRFFELLWNSVQETRSEVGVTDWHTRATARIQSASRSA